MSGASAIVLKPIPYGWCLYLTDGRRLACFRGPGAKARALRYLSRITGVGAAARR